MRAVAAYGCRDRSVSYGGLLATAAKHGSVGPTVGYSPASCAGATLPRHAAVAFPLPAHHVLVQLRAPAILTRARDHYSDDPDKRHEPHSAAYNEPDHAALANLLVQVSQGAEHLGPPLAAIRQSSLV